MSVNELNSQMTELLHECGEDIDKFKPIIARAVQLGMRYQTEKIKSGIQIVFNAL